MEKTTFFLMCCCIVGAMLILILVPLSFSYVDYYDYGLAQRKSTGSVDTNQVYTNGRYMLGPDRHFIKYQADAHLESFDELSVFSATTSNMSIGLAFQVDIDYTFFLKKDKIGLLHQELATDYRNVIVSRAEEAIKNIAAEQVSFTEFFQQRKKVEALFRSAVETRWQSPPSLHCELDQFHLGRITIPKSVATKQLESRVQNERNDMEQFLQKSQMEREKTTVEVNKVDLETVKELRTARAEASLVKTRAQAEAALIISHAEINGTQMLLDAAEINTQDHKTAFTYIKMLRDRHQLDIAVSYLDGDSVVRTAPA
eukprot:CCRYP_000049-RB/>CCRYP_000049-RB protein AED:0.11 eAED:0.11 QI:1916/1/1/1/0.75/0.6/5/318/313